MRGKNILSPTVRMAEAKQSPPSHCHEPRSLPSSSVTVPVPISPLLFHRHLILRRGACPRRSRSLESGSSTSTGQTSFVAGEGAEGSGGGQHGHGGGAGVMMASSLLGPWLVSALLPAGSRRPWIGLEPWCRLSTVAPTPSAGALHPGWSSIRGVATTGSGGIALFPYCSSTGSGRRSRIEGPSFDGAS
jgi:hypothetical protein